MYSRNVRDHFNCSPSFSHEQHHETDAAKPNGGWWRRPEHRVVAGYDIPTVIFQSCSSQRPRKMLLYLISDYGMVVRIV